MPRQKRTFQESHKRIVASKQAWQCASCNIMLPSAFQVDHVIPLWKGGIDCISNAVAICANCHAQKTQQESIERTLLKRTKAIKEQEQFESVIRDEENKKVTISDLNAGKQRCDVCNLVFYKVFKHINCPVIQRHIKERIELRDRKYPRPDPSPEPPSPFVRFTYLG